MQVDRARFLYLVTAIAAGCGGRDEPGPTVPPSVIIAAPEPDGSDEDAVLVVEPSPTSTQQQPSTAPFDEWGGEPTAPTHEGGYTSSAATSGMCRAGAVGTPVAKGCRDDVGTPGSCQGGPLTSLCGILQFHCGKCDSYKQYFKPRVAARAVACVQMQSMHQAQDGCETYRCGDAALKSACHDATAEGPCRVIARQCNESVAECTQLLSGMNAAGRAEVAACAARGCSFGLWSCVEGM